MTVDHSSEEGQVIRQLIPLSTLSINQFEALCSKITVEVATAHTFLFQKSDTAKDLIYLLDGSITLQSNEIKIETIKSGTKSSRFALAHQIPRKIDAYTNTSVRFLRLNTDFIEKLPDNSLEKDNSYMVIDEPEFEIDSEGDSDDDWMTALLKSPIMKVLPPANIQKMIIGLEEVSFDKGDLIVKQGDEGDYYYIILNGQCLVSRKPSVNAKEIKLAQLSTQDCFGEDSLLTDEPRNVNITALTDAKLLRLSKDKFISLVKEPTLKFISHAQIKEEQNLGSILLDVRPPDEFKKHRLPGSVNMPFFSLRMQLKTFDKKKTVVLICANGKTSEAAAFLLIGSKYKALIVEGGMEQEPQEAKESLADIEVVDIENTIQHEETLQSEDETLKDETSIDQNALLQENEQLKQAVQKLSTEKKELENRYRNLYKQTEKLKAALDSLKKQ